MRSSSKCLATGLLIAIFAFTSAGQSGSGISGPTLGFLTDEEGSTFWPLLGILGATVPGQPLALTEGITGAVISPQHDYAIARSASSGQPVIIHLDLQPPTVVSLESGRTNPTLIAISPVGTAAALYDRESGVLQLVSGLPSTPQVVFEFDTSTFGGDVRDIAISDDGRLALVNAGGDSRTLWAVNANGSVLPVSASQPSKMVFLAQRPDALIADDATQEIFLLQDLAQNPVRLPGVVLRDVQARFSAIAASRDGQFLFAAQHDSQDVTIVNLQTRETTVLRCYCTPTRFTPLKGSSTFRLNGLATGPLSVLDASSATPRTVLIPIGPDALARNESREQ